jgi:exodeoxyribonuclease VII large subunit
MNTDITLSVGEFVSLINQTLEYAYPNVIVTGELANFKVSKNRWVYFDLKDDEASVRFFGTIYQLPGPLEDGMLLAVQGMPRLHPQYGFSVTVQSMRPTGEGSIKKAAALLQAKLTAEGLFDPARKRALPYPPESIGLIASGESAAYHDFTKVIGVRWGGLAITHVDVQVQGEASASQIVAAIEQCNQMANPPEVLVITRGGGSAEDLQAFSTEQVTRAVAASRIPTVVAIGHEVDVSLAELAADLRASTPSNAAELLVPDRRSFLANLRSYQVQLKRAAEQAIVSASADIALRARTLHDSSERIVGAAQSQVELKRQLLEAFDPTRALQRGYALVRVHGAVVQAKALQINDSVLIDFADGTADASITRIKLK